MSDSFADLWSSSAPLSTKPKPQTLSSAASRQTSSANANYGANTGSKPDLFAMLSSSGSGTATPRYGGGMMGNTSSNGLSNGSRASNPPSRTMTPSSSAVLGAGAGAGVARTTSAAGTSISRTGSAAGATPGGVDAFSDLFSPSSSTISTSTAANKNMTLAARLAMEAEQKRVGAGSLGGGAGIGRSSSSAGAGSHAGASGSDAASTWAGLDSLAGGGSILKADPPASSSSTTARSKPNIDDADDWGLGDFGMAPPISAPVPPTTRRTTRTQTTAQSIAAAAAAAETSRESEKKQTTGVSLWDLDDFKDNTNDDSGFRSAQQNNGTSNARTYSPEPSSAAAANPPRSSKPLFFEDENDVGVASPDQDFDFGAREDLDDRDRVRDRGRGLLDFDEGEDDFGFGSSERRGGNANGNDSHRAGDEEDDILGMLSKPVEVVKARVEADGERQRLQPPRAQAPSNASSNRPRPSSPPPHVLGQIVEMGFSITQAKKALAGTKDGMDVQAALESLLGGGASGSRSGTPPPAPPVAAPAPAAAARARGPPKGQKERERERLEKQRLAAGAASSSSGASGSGISGSALNADNITEQADKLIAQASELGMNMFSKASAFWREGKERVVKAYEEREAGGGIAALAPGAKARGVGKSGVSGAGGRPKWMVDGPEHEGQDEEGFPRRVGKQKETSAFRDGWESDEDTRHDDAQRDRSETKVVAQQEQPEVEVDLFAPDVPSQPTSRGGQRQQGSSSSISTVSVRGPARPSPPAPSAQRARTPVPAPTRNLPTASPSALALALKHKTAGTEQFKLGQHAAAADSYGLALQALPDGHLLRVPLLTNRAIARLRIGEYKTAVADCERAVEGVVGRTIFASGAEDSEGGFGVDDPLADKPTKGKNKSTPPPVMHPSTIPPSILSAGRAKANDGGWAHPQGLGVDLLDQYVKAVKRAAEALEGREQWEQAGVWWGVLGRAAEGEAGAWVHERERKEAVSGGVRCRKMVDGPAAPARSASTMPAPKPQTPQTKRPSPKASAASVSSAPSKALRALQSNNAQAEADDAAKHALKDTVDARLSAWKAGKETNIRALLASLENVLWEGDVMRGLKMGMADLVSAAQVKKGYVKAIARVHPDKLNAGNSTLEQRMLANGVFGGLNEAWIAFQATQK
ncbi:UBA domain-containing protein 7 [Psilocybe cubensis]|uniref:UBA domain-containing protein 7 n=2 Tax=Psilocybe cubensis TaxID=181762 RepID=A0ACB8H9Y4_PSICU|nr:UBA domain-containing protein 7 [Psilocybe cubensis]KAH9484618.1 UBA domain-containing protein 7 [Psilocybe cubensis]